MKIAFQGLKGAYSEMAIQGFLNSNSFYKQKLKLKLKLNEAKKNQSPLEIIGFPFSEDVCDAIKDERVTIAALPIENSIVGNVNVNLELIYKNDFSIVGEYFQPINHCLMGIHETNLKKIKKVYSHPVALDQCRIFLKEYNIEAVPTYDTAGACQKVSNSKNSDLAAIASSLCSDYYNLNILQEKIQNNSNNITRFIFFTKKSNRPKNILMEKTTLAFKTTHRPGALLDCLQVFACFKINLTRLISKTIPEDPFSYVFFVDFEGGKKEEKIILALKALELHTKEIKILGSYPIQMSSN